MADPSCAPPLSGDWNITNTAVLCDNGTAITVDGVIRLSNATLNVTNGTSLNATSYIVAADSTLLMNESSSTNASLYITGNATFDSVNIDAPTILINESAVVNATTMTFNVQGNITLIDSSSFTLTESNLLLVHEVLDYIWVNDTATISFLGGSTWRGSIEGSGNIIISDVNLTSIDNAFLTGLLNANITITNLTDDGQLNIQIYNASRLVATDVTGAYQLTLRGGGASGEIVDFHGRGLSLTGLDASGVTLNMTNSSINETFVPAEGALLTLYGSNNISAADITFTYVTPTIEGETIITGNVSFNDAATAQFLSIGNATRVYPLHLFNESGDPLVSENVTIIANLGSPGSYSWTGTTDANGYIEPNITFTSANYDSTFYFSLPDFDNQYSTVTLLSDTPINWSGIQTVGPFYTGFEATSASIGTGSFGFNITVSNDTTQLNYTIGNGSHTWTNGTYNGSELNTSDYALSLSFDGFYLPAGNWTLDIAFSNGTASRVAQANFTSAYAIVSALTSEDEGEATIGGDNIEFTFNLTVKSAGSVIAAYLDLVAGEVGYDANNAFLSNGSDQVAIGNAGYAGAGNLTLPGTTAAPSYVEMNLSEEIFSDQLTMIIVPYSGLAAGSYSGSYGFGIFG